MNRIVGTRKILVIVIILCLIPNYGGASIIIQESNAKKCVSIEVTNSSSQYVAKTKIHKINTEELSEEGEKYTKLWFDDLHTLQNIGEPALPVLIQHIGLPHNCSYDVQIKNEKWKKIQIGKIYPFQGYKTGMTVNSPFKIKEELYSEGTYEFPLIDESDIMTWKGIGNVYLSICPFKYYPSQNEIFVMTEYTLIVNFYHTKNDSDDRSFIDRGVDLEVFDNSSFYRTDMINKGSKSSLSCDSNYLIIVGNIPEIENSEAMKRFRKWKALKGYGTKLVSTSTIGSDSTSIKNYITQQYQLGINRVLFIGTQEKIPIPTFTARVVNSVHPIVKSDYWYGCVDGVNDIQGDLPIARFVTNSLADFTNMVDKTIKYESQYHEWCNNSLLVSYTINYPSLQAPLDTVYERYHHIVNFYKDYAAPSSLGGNDATIVDVVNHINSGVNIVTINAHGNAGGFWLFDGDNSTLHYEHTNLFNSETYPVFLSNACSNGDFTSDYSIIKTFTRSDHCVSAYVAASVPSFTFAQNELTKILYSKLLDEQQYTLGDLILNSHVANLSYGNTAIDNAFSVICSGDPSLELWTGDQSLFNDIDISIQNNDIIVSTNGIDGYGVNVVSADGQLIGKYYSSEATTTIPLLDNNCDIAIIKHNYVPYVAHINVEDHCIQNITFTGNTYYLNSPMYIGNNVISYEPSGNVVVEPNSKVEIVKGSGVYIKNGFECKKGATFVIK